MAKAAAEKTNVMRILSRKKIPYQALYYDGAPGLPVDGASVAARIGRNPAQVFKTLVTQGASGQHYVFDIPVLASLDLKKAARAVGEKSVVLLPLGALTPLTGYVRGGCSPIGMKKQFPTVLHNSALDQETVIVSAGKIGVQVELAAADLLAAADAITADVVSDAES